MLLAASVFVVAYCAIGISMAVFLAWALVSTRTPPWTKRGALALWLIFVILLNCYCAAMTDHFLRMGGSAVNGKIVAGRYFLGSHGRYTEVSEAIWRSSYWHRRLSEWAVWAFFLTGFGVAALAARRSARAQSSGESPDGDEAAGGSSPVKSR